MDALFDIERDINGRTAAERLAVRQELSRPLAVGLESWTREQRAKLANSNPVAKAMNYMLTRWESFTRFLDDGRICITNNAAERALRGIALGRNYAHPVIMRGLQKREDRLPRQINRIAVSH